jgi:hypothetical protein
MQILMMLTTCALLFYTIYLNVDQQQALSTAHTALVHGRLDSAMASLDSARRTWPQFYAGRVRSLCGDITLTRARHLADTSPAPDFLGAAGLVRTLPTQCGTSEREAETVHVLAYI